MNRNRFTVTPFNQLKLTTNDRQQLVEIADTLVSAKLEEYEEYLSNEMQVDLDRWKKFTKTGPTTMYLERKNTNPGSNMHTLLMTGPLPGTLDENMFGLVSPTLESMRIKTSYLEDFSAGAVLATIVEPTEEEPFRSVVVKWMEIDIPGASLGVIRNRDYVYLESTGIMQLKNGESLGFHLLHSVSFPQTHERSGRVRGNMSLCAILQQDGPERTKCRGSGLMDPAGDMIRAIAVIGIVQATMAAVKYSYCGQMKKLAWLLNKQHAKARERSARVLKPECE